MVEQVFGLFEEFRGRPIPNSASHNGLELWGWCLTVSPREVTLQRQLFRPYEQNNSQNWDGDTCDEKEINWNSKANVKSHRNAILGKDYNFLTIGNEPVTWRVPLADVKTIEKAKSSDLNDRIRARFTDVLFLFARDGRRLIIAELCRPALLFTYQAQIQQAIQKVREQVKREASSKFEGREYL